MLYWQRLFARTGRADCVVINFDCCSAYGDHGFCQGEGQGFGRRPHHTHHTGAAPDASLELIAGALERGHLVMCSDFSLKALIAKWEGNSSLAVRLGRYAYPAPDVAERT